MSCFFFLWVILMPSGYLQTNCLSCTWNIPFHRGSLICSDELCSTYSLGVNKITTYSLLHPQWLPLCSVIAYYPLYPGCGKGRFIIVSAWKSLFLYYLCTIVLFSIESTVSLLVSHPVYSWNKMHSTWNHSGIKAVFDATHLSVFWT